MVSRRPLKEGWKEAIGLHISLGVGSEIVPLILATREEVEQIPPLSLS